MATGRDFSDQSFIVIKEAFLKDSGWTVTQTLNRSLYVEDVSYIFVSRKYRPTPLTNTAGTITRQRRNVSHMVVYTTPDVRTSGPAYYVAQGPSRFDSKASDGSGLSSQAQKRLNSRDLNLGVILVEGRETYRMLADAAIAVSTAYKQLKARDAKGALKTLGVSISGKAGKRIDRNTIEKGAANSWLQIQFGWLPLFNDVYSAVKQSYDSLEKGRTIRGRAQRGSRRGSDTFDPNYVPRASVSWSGTVSSPRLVWLQSFGLLNPLTIAWEATRLSYMFDWLFQMNTFLNTLTATAGLSDTRSSSVEENISVSYRGSTAVSTFQNIKRTTGASISMGNPLNFDMGGWHVATALAQAKQVFR